MSWSIIDRKVSRVRSQLNNWELQVLEREFIESINRFSGSYRLSKSIKGVLFLDLAYAIAQHKDWLHTPVFSVLLVEFLQFDHGIRRNDAEILVHDVVEAAIQLDFGGQRQLCRSDRDFLTCAYVSAMDAQDDSFLELELGLGTAVLRKLRDGVKALESVDQNVFVPEYDAMLASIVLELSQELKEVPWALDHYRVKFALLRAGGDAAQPFILVDSLPLMLDAITAIGQGHSSTLFERPALASLMVQADLIMEAKSHPKRKVTGHIISDLGARFTALKLSSSLQQLPSVSSFLKLHNAWQQAIIKRSLSINFDYLQSLLSTAVNKLSPEVIEATIGRMIGLNSARIDVNLVKKALESCDMDWHKAAIIRSLRNLNPSRALLDLVASEVGAASSPGIKMAVGSLLDIWTDK